MNKQNSCLKVRYVVYAIDSDPPERLSPDWEGEMPEWTLTIGLLEKYWGFGIVVGGNQNYPQSYYLKMIWREK